jgi:hypothetical protein
MNAVHTDNGHQIKSISTYGNITDSKKGELDELDLKIRAIR